MAFRCCANLILRVLRAANDFDSRQTTPRARDVTRRSFGRVIRSSPASELATAESTISRVRARSLFFEIVAQASAKHPRTRFSRAFASVQKGSAIAPGGTQSVITQ